MFEDEGDDNDDEDKGSLFGIKPATNINTVAPAVKVSTLNNLLYFYICHENNLLFWKITSSGL